MSTSGLVVSTAPTSGSAPAEHVDDAGRDVGVVGDQLAERQRDQRGVRRALEHDRAAGGQRGRQLGQRQLVGIVVGDDRGDDAGGFLLHPAVVLHAAALDVAEVLGHRVGLQQIGVVADDRDRLRRVGRPGTAPASHRPRRWSARRARRGGRPAPGATARGSGFAVRCSVDQSVVSNARRAAATAASASATVASGAWPTTSPVAGLIEGNVRGVSTSLPSISIRRSARAHGVGRPLEIVDASVIHTPSM